MRRDDGRRMRGRAGRFAAVALVLVVAGGFVARHLRDAPPSSGATRACSLATRPPAADEAPETTKEIGPEDVVPPQPVVRDAAPADPVETDNDLPAEESVGEDGISDAPFTGPAQNGAIGFGGAPGGRWRRGGVEDAVHRARPPFTTEGYDRLPENPFVRTADQDVSTFAIDVDTASYANVRRFLRDEGRLPPKDAVRIEELVNYFSYAYEPPPPGSEHPFLWHATMVGCPWAPAHRLLRVALKGRVLDAATRPAANLVFLIDVSGSMNAPNKLPLVQSALGLLVPLLDARDRVSIVVYAGAAGQVLAPTSGAEHEAIREAVDRLRAGGSTNGGQGIELAYRCAVENRIEGGVNRVILCTDGDFNVGVSDHGALTRMIEAKAKQGVFLTVLGFGTGNLKDDLLEQLSDRGDGNYAYVDDLAEARKVFVEQGLSTLVTIAKDVKIQVFFNPAKVAGWRLLGYEDRRLAKQDFNDDTKDAGEVGAGHAVTALYEIVPAGQGVPGPVPADPNPFVAAGGAPSLGANAWLRVRARYQPPSGGASTLLEQDVPDGALPFEAGDLDLQWASAVAGFAMMLRDDPEKEQCSWALVEEIARAARGDDPHGYRAEMLRLVELARSLAQP